MIQPTSNLFGSNPPLSTGASAHKHQAPAPAAESVGERLSSTNSEALRSALKNSPEVRPEVVERGKSLAVDTNYPPRQIIDSIARLMTETADLSEKA